MSRKRPVPARFFSNGVPTPNVQAYQYEYYRPGCYYIPQDVRQVTPYVNTYFNHWQPYCNTATYVVDPFGRANYPSDFEYQLQVPTVIHHLQPANEILYQYYDNGETELASLPQIEEDDCIENENDVSVRKRKHFNDGNGHYRNKICCKEFGNENIYRANEGYLVEEPNDNL